MFSNLTPEKEDVLGAMSLIFWSITLIVLLKYVCIVLNANDQGEGQCSRDCGFTEQCMVRVVRQVERERNGDGANPLISAQYGIYLLIYGTSLE